MRKEDELINKIFFKKYQILKKIGKGSFGSVYLGKNISNDEHYAVKFEPKNQQDLILERESYLLYYLRGFGIPEIITYGHNSKYNILIQTLLGKSINKIFIKNDYKFSMKDCCMIGIQILERLEYIHSKFIIHRDVKPDNFLIGNPDKEIIYIIDFGLAKKYMSSKTRKHAKFVINKKWSGTSRFASANSLRGVAQSRRDDLESLCYLLLYLMKGNLPWDNVYGINENEEILLIYKIKKYMKPELLFMNLPKETAEFFSYCKKLEYEQKPDYNYLKNLLLNILNFSQEKNDLKFSWINSDKSELYSYNIENNKFKRIIKKKNTPRQNLYNSLISKKINLAKRSESYNNIRKNNQLENKVKKNCDIVKNVSPNLRHVKFNNLFKTEKIQKYKYIKKIPNGKRKIIIQSDNLKKNSSLIGNSNTKTQIQTENNNKGKINIIPLNVSKIGKNKKNNNVNIPNQKNVIKEKKIIFKKYQRFPEERANNYIIKKNNSFNFKSNKINLLNYFSNNYKSNYGEYSGALNLNNIYNINQNTNNKINIIRNKSLTRENNNYKYYRSINFNDSLNNNNNNYEINSIKTFNNNSLSLRKHYLYNNIQMNSNNNLNNNLNNHISLHENTKNKYLRNLNLFNRNDINNLKKQERINLTNNNIQNNYNINIDINNSNNSNNSSFNDLKNLKYNKNKKDLKIINIISPINKTSFYRKVKKNSFSPNIPQTNKINQNKNNIESKEIFNKFFGENNKNDIFEKYYSNADIMKKYKKIQKEIKDNKINIHYDNSFDYKYIPKKSNIKKSNSLFIKGDFNSYNEKLRYSHNDILRIGNSFRYVSPKSVEKYKSKY